MQLDPHTSLNGKHGPAKITEKVNQKVTASTPVPNRQPTIFAEPVPVTNWQSFLHTLSRAEVTGIPLLRLITGIWLVVALLGLAGALPGGWLVGVLLLVALIVFQLQLLVQRRRDFVQFVPSTLPAVTLHKLPSEDKLPVYVTGECGVEGKHRHFTLLPAFYRTFATREHALLCQVKARRIFMLATWSTAEVGLWYVFFMPSAIQLIRMGTLQHGWLPQPALAIDYLQSYPVKKNSEVQRTEKRTIYLSSPNEADLQIVLADLLVDAPTKVLELVPHNA